MPTKQPRNAFGHFVLVMAMVILCAFAVQLGLAGARLQATVQPESKSASGAVAETPVIAHWRATRGTTGCIDAKEAHIVDRYRSNPRAQLKAVMSRRMAEICFGVRSRSVLTEHESHATHGDALKRLALEDGRLVYVPRRDVVPVRSKQISRR